MPSRDFFSSLLEDAEDYKAFEAAIIADYDAQSAVERELVLRLASLLWRLRRATIMETGLFEIQAEYLREFRKAAPSRPHPVCARCFGSSQTQEKGCRFHVGSRQYHVG